MTSSLSQLARTCALLALGGLATLTAEAAEARPPNIVFILADDLGWADLGHAGSRYYETPHLDRLAAQGMRFTQGYAAAPNCAPTRAALLTGQYGPRTGVYTVGGDNRYDTSARPLVPVSNVEDLAASKVTVAEALRGAGYATGMFGKWHLGRPAPSDQGFDEAIVAWARHYGFKPQPSMPVEKGTYLADFLTDHAVDFIERHHARPFFLYVPHFGVHSPFQAKPELVARFKDKPADGGHRDPVYAAMIASVDESVGRILAKLDELGLAETTLVIFSSDNGGLGGYATEGLPGGAWDSGQTHRDITSNAPLRGGKGMFREGGIRVPWLFRWPGRVTAGSVCDAPITSVDFYPTLLALSGARAPQAHPLDGVDISPLFAESPEARSAFAERPLFWHFPGYLGGNTADSWRATPQSAIRLGDFKLAEFLEDGRVELFNLRADVGETRDLAAEQPALAANLRERLHAWRNSIAAPMPARRETPSSHSLHDLTPHHDAPHRDQPRLRRVRGGVARHLARHASTRRRRPRLRPAWRSDEQLHS